MKYNYATSAITIESKLIGWLDHVQLQDATTSYWHFQPANPSVTAETLYHGSIGFISMRDAFDYLEGGI